VFFSNLHHPSNAAGGKGGRRGQGWTEWTDAPARFFKTGYKTGANARLGGTGPVEGAAYELSY